MPPVCAAGRTGFPRFPTRTKTVRALRLNAAVPGVRAEASGQARRTVRGPPFHVPVRPAGGRSLPGRAFAGGGDVPAMSSARFLRPSPSARVSGSLLPGAGR
ncbi:hypothetical protein APS67_003025 [Streptomyces sp. AVP053U2]|nr:hypothetical protein APS67_003025 [Streptomyces sp. AVP053U2]